MKRERGTEKEEPRRAWRGRVRRVERECEMEWRRWMTPLPRGDALYILLRARFSWSEEKEDKKKEQAF